MEVINVTVNFFSRVENDDDLLLHNNFILRIYPDGTMESNGLFSDFILGCLNDKRSATETRSMVFNLPSNSSKIRQIDKVIKLKWSKDPVTNVELIMKEISKILKEMDIILDGYDVKTNSVTIIDDNTSDIGAVNINLFFVYTTKEGLSECQTD